MTKEEEQIKGKALKIRFGIYDCLLKDMTISEISEKLSIPVKIINEQLEYMRNNVTTWMFFN